MPLESGGRERSGSIPESRLHAWTWETEGGAPWFAEEDSPTSTQTLANEFNSSNGFESRLPRHVSLLHEHSNFVRVLCLIDETRFASGGDDGLVCVWNALSGTVIFKCEGHTLPITCLSMLSPSTFVSGSSDRTMRLWNADDGTCLKTISAHEGSVRCLVPMSDGRFISGANDRTMRLWSRVGDALGSMQRHETEPQLNCMLLVRRDLLITGSNSSLLLVYHLEPPAFDRALMGGHRESVRCLLSASESVFVSGSEDGTIVVWGAARLRPLRALHWSQGRRRVDVTVQQLTMLDQRHLAVAVGTGFRIFELDGVLVADCSRRHESTVLNMTTMLNGTVLVTASGDGSVRCWAAGPDRESETGVSWRRIVLLGGLMAHSDAVHDVLALPGLGMASAGSDGVVALWKDDRVVRTSRCQAAQSCLEKEADEARCVLHDVLCESPWVDK